MVKKGRRILLVSAALILACLLTVLLWPVEKEPVYGGKKLSEWALTRDLNSQDVIIVPSGGALSVTASEAILGMGTNALPFLVKWVSEEPSPAKRATYRLLKDCHLAFPYESLQRTDMRSAFSMRAFQILGPTAQPAIPALYQMMTNAASPGSSARARMSLAYIGEPALPYLVAALTNRWPYRYELPNTLAFMGRDGTDVRSTIPTLISLMKAPDQPTSIYSVEALGTLARHRIDRDKALPALIEATHDPRPKVRLQAVLSLGVLTDAQDVTPILINSMDDPDWEVASMAICMFARDHPHPELVIPAILERLKPADSVRIRTQLEALAHYGLDARPAVPAILQIMDKPASPGVWVAASNALYRIDPQALR